MAEIKYPFRKATRNDAIELAELANMAGEGLPLYIWQEMSGPGQSAWEVGRARVQREEGAFSYRNAVVRMERDEIAACLLGYPLQGEASPDDSSGVPPMFVPLQQLEAMAAGTWYINFLATYPEHRGKGYAHELLALAAVIAIELEKPRLTLIIADTNLIARRLYEQQGYREVASRVMIKGDWQHPGSRWILLARDL
jgi:ribosomal protein S18 acetylase RimI-like enzyme